MSNQPIDKLKLVLAVASGMLLTAAFPQAGHGIFAWFAIVPLMVAVNHLSPFDAFRLGFLAGLVHYGSLLYWFVPFLHTYGPFPIYLSAAVLLLLSAYLALYVACFSMMLVWLCPSSFSCFFGAPLIWVSLEYLRSIVFSGFPWELLGYSQYHVLHLIQIADLFSVYGVSFMLVLFNTLLFLTLMFFAKRRWQDCNLLPRQIKMTALLTVVVFAAAWGYGAWRIQTMDQTIARTPTQRIAVIQGNIDQSLKWDAAHQLFTIRHYLELSATQQAKKPDLIVWPETAMPFYMFHQGLLTQQVISGIQKADTDFLVSSPFVARSGQGLRYLNRAFLIQGSGLLQDTYDKAHLVPFGEYVPLKKWLPFLGKIVEQVGDFSAGEAGDILAWRDHRIGMLICYELIFPYLSRAAVRNGAEFLINITNDAWYGESSAPYQHFSMAVFRAVENRRALVRSANTGISGFIDPLGRILCSTPIFKETALTKDVPLLNIASGYAIWGDAFAGGCVILIIALMMRRWRQARQLHR